MSRPVIGGQHPGERGCAGLRLPYAECPDGGRWAARCHCRSRLRLPSCRHRDDEDLGVGQKGSGVVALVWVDRHSRVQLRPVPSVASQNANPMTYRPVPVAEERHSPTKASLPQRRCVRQPRRCRTAPWPWPGLPRKPTPSPARRRFPRRRSLAGRRGRRRRGKSLPAPCGCRSPASAAR